MESSLGSRGSSLGVFNVSSIGGVLRGCQLVPGDGLARTSMTRKCKAPSLSAVVAEPETTRTSKTSVCLRLSLTLAVVRSNKTDPAGS
jgi:hypothetical protein